MPNIGLVLTSAALVVPIDTGRVNRRMDDAADPWAKVHLCRKGSTEEEEEGEEENHRPSGRKLVAVLHVEAAISPTTLGE
jgi:hypothetical protein